MFKKLSLIVLLAIASNSYSQIPPYYNDVDLTLSGAALKNELATKIINTHITFLPYGWPVIQQTDLDPNNNTNVLLIYGSSDTDGNYVTDRTRNLNSNGGTPGSDWNREHTYPKSLGNPNLGTSGPGADIHHLRASDVTMNNNRGNLKFNSGTGVADFSGAGWYPGDEWKGDVARMMMYMYLRYGSRCLPSGVAIGTANSIDSNMIDLLLNWNAEDPVSQYETNRNNILETEQGNRNPFIDNPAFATEIWEGTQAEDLFSGESTEKEINIQGNSVSIADGSVTTNTNNNTSFGSIDTASGTIIKTFTIKNTGGTTLTLSGNPTISTGNVADYSVTANPGILSLPSGSSTTFQITFNPSSDGIKTTTVTVLSDDADEGTYTFIISGVGTESGGTGSGGICGSETFTNSNAPSGGYGNGSFIGDNNITWSYIEARDDEGYEVSGKGLMLRNTTSRITSNTVTGGIGNFTISLKKGFTGGGSRQVALYINNNLAGTSIAWDNTITQTFSVTGINLTGDVIIEIRNTRGKQVIVDDISWTCFTATPPEINLEGNANPIPNGSTSTNTINNTDFGSADTASSSIVKSFTIHNLGGNILTLTSNPTISSGEASDFSLTSNPNLTIDPGAITTFSITFNPSADGLRTTTVTILSDDADEATYTFSISGTGTTGAKACATISGATLFQQDFEVSPATPELTYTSTNTSVSSGIGLFPSDNMFYEGTQGIKSTGIGGIVFDAIDVSSYSTIDFTFKLAAFSTTSGNGMEDTDYIKVWVSTDGGSTESEELIVTGSPDYNAYWSFTTGTSTASTVYSGANPQTTFTPTGSGASTVNPYGTVTITNLPSSSTLRIRIEIKRNNSKEIWVIDDAKITGDSESITTWTGSWSAGSPSDTVKVILESDYDMTTEASLETCECEVKPGNTLTISGDKYLKVENNIINNGSIIIEDSGNLLQVSDLSNISGSGSYTVKRTTPSVISRYVYTYWSSPLTSSALNEVSSDGNLYYSFNPSTQNWVNANASTSMTPGLSYAVQGPNAGVTYPGSYTAEFTGSKFNNGEVDVPLALGASVTNGADDNWNLIGNPYPSAIDANILLSTNSNIWGTIYFWTHNTDASTTQNFTQDDYVSWNGTGGTAGCNGCIAPNGNIASGQGFFAQAITPSTLTFSNNMRIGVNNNNFYRTPDSKVEDKIWLNLSSNNSFKQILIGFLKKATDGIDRLYDGEKIDGGTKANFYSLINNKQFVIQGRSTLKKAEEIPLGFSTNTTGEFMISIDHFEGDLESSIITLQDNLLNIEHDLKNSNYFFKSIATGTFNSRFKLIINKGVLNTDSLETGSKLIIKNSSNGLVLKTSDQSLIKKVLVYDILGKEILIKEASASIIELESVSLKSNSILILKILLESGELIVNKILKN